MGKQPAFSFAAQEPEDTAARPLFNSFLQGGFEGACHINSKGQRLDMLAATQHDRFVDEDYARLSDAGIKTVRESVRWHLVDQGGRYDFSSLEPFVAAARRHKMQIIWSLCHYGWPDELDLFSAEFIYRFCRYTSAVCGYIAERTEGAPFYSPFNEMSFVAYAIGTRGFMYPYAVGRGGDIKRQLIRATIAATETIWGVDPRARLVHVDPVLNVVAPRERPDLAKAAAQYNHSQYEAADMLTGKICPELGGHPSYLDVVGLNFYHANQWELPENRLRWEDSPRDERWVPFSRLLRRAAAYYKRPLFIAETSHFGSGRAPWLNEVADEVCKAWQAGVRLEGLCIYPILDRPDWEETGLWHNSGLWDLEGLDGTLERKLNADYAVAVRRLQNLTASFAAASNNGDELPPRPAADSEGEGEV